MKKIILALTAATALFATEEPKSSEWELSLNTNLTATLSQYSKNWTGEERGNFTWASNILGTANKQLTSAIRMENSAKFAFGQTAFEKSNNKWDTLQVTTDLIDLQNMELLTMGWIVDPYLAVRAEGFFMNQTATNNKVKYLNPWVLTQSFGARIEFLKAQEDQNLKVRFGGAIKENWERQDTTIINGGLELITEYETKLSTNLHYKTKLALFEALFVSGDPVNDDWKMVDVVWDNDFVANISKYIMVTYTLGLQYDKEVAKEARLRQALSAGFNFGWSNK